MRTLILLCLLAAIITGCLQPEFPEDSTFSNLTFSPYFTWRTDESVNFKISQQLTDELLKVELYEKADDRMNLLGSFFIGNSPSYLDIQLSSGTDSLWIRPLTIGSSGMYVVTLDQPVIDLIPEHQVSLPTADLATSSNLRLKDFIYLGEFASDGVPDYLEPQRDMIATDLLQDISASLPEGMPVPQFNPAYITSNNLDTHLTDSAEVYLTFVHEGAAWRNAIGFYTYDLDNPPTSAAEAGNLTIIFPNTSFLHSGGGLHSGDKVYLGKFSPNTGIGWFLVPNGWRGNSVQNGNEIKFSNPALNTFTESAYQQHVVILNDRNRELLLMGFEDTSRPGGDNDFNDAIFYVSANPFSAIKTAGLQEIQQATDIDQDGIFDHLDDFPTDPEASAVSFYPSESEYASLAFEDMWPVSGDYDFNDLVVDFNFEIRKNNKQEIVRLIATFNIRAVGGGHKNGFAIELPIDAEQVEQVSGPRLSGKVFEVQSNGIEKGNKRAVIPIFDNAYDVFEYYGPNFINTQPGIEKHAAREMKIDIRFSRGVTSLGAAPYNPFIIIAQNRGHEIHLPNQPPTERANMDLFGTSDDASDLTKGRYYRTRNNLPWAILISSSFDYPSERKSIHQAHLRFRSWAQSSGTSYRRWYKNASGHRDPLYIYK